MKLKKFAALALAGVMAVSMLAGCASKPVEEPTEEPTTSTFTSDLIAALEEEIGDKDYVTVGTDATLQKNLDAVATAYGFSATSNEMIEGAMQKVDAKLSTKYLPLVNASDVEYKDAIADHTVFSIVNTSFSKATTNYTAVDNLVNAMMADAVTDQGAVSPAAANSLASALHFGKSYGAYKSTDVNKVTSYTGLEFKYQINVATTKVENTMTGNGYYVVAYTVTRTATSVAAENSKFGLDQF